MIVPPAGTKLRHKVNGKVVFVHESRLDRGSDTFFASEHPCARGDWPEKFLFGRKTATTGMCLGWFGERADGLGSVEVRAMLWDGGARWEIIHA